MNEKKNESFSGIFDRVIKKHIAIAVMSFFAVLIVASGVSYSLFQIDKRNTTNQTVAVGTLDANITSIAGGIVVSDLYPQKESAITDEDKKYVFTISNTGTYDIEYEVYLKDSTDALLSSTNDYSSYKRISSEHYRYINYKLDGKRAKNLSSIKSGEKFIVLKGFLAAGESEEHSIQFFLDDGDTTELGAPNDISGSVLSLDIYFEGAVGQINTMVKSDDTIWQYKTNIKTITFENTLSEKNGAEYTYNIGANEDNPVMAYMIPTEEDATMYNVYIQADGMTRSPKNSSSLFDGFTNLVSVEGMEYFDTSNVTNMDNMFYNCNVLATLDVSNFDTSKVTSMANLFYHCHALTTLDVSSFDTSKVTNMSNMFYNCIVLATLDLSSFDTSNVTDMGGMFSHCNALTTLDVSNFDTSNVTDMGGMFLSCHSLTTLDLSHFDTSNVTVMGIMFMDCQVLTTLDVSHFDTSNVTNMNGMFSMCYALTTLDLSHFDTSNVTNMAWMFYNCKALTTVITVRGTKCTDYSSMFSSAARNSGAQITVNYTADASSLVDSMIGTKSSNSNVVKGTQVA